MFKMPEGEPIDVEVTTEKGAIQKFDTGVISTFFGRRKTPAAHRIVRAGRVIGYLCDGLEKGQLLGGDSAEARINELEASDKPIHRVNRYSSKQLAMVVELVPEAFEDFSETFGLVSGDHGIHRMMSRDLASITKAMNEQEVVKGALAIDSGMVIDSQGEIGGDPEEVAAMVSNLIKEQDSVTAQLGIDGRGYWTIRGGNSDVLMAKTGDFALAVWTESGVDHNRLMNEIMMNLSGEMVALGSDGVLPEGFLMRTGKGGSDAILSMMKTAKDEQVDGHIKAGGGDNAVHIVLSAGIPVAVSGQKGLKFDELIHRMTDGKLRIELHRLGAESILTAESGTVKNFSLTKLRELISKARSRTEARVNTLQIMFDDLFLFEMGLESISKARKNQKFKLKSKTPNVKVSESVTDIAKVDTALRRKLEKAEISNDELAKELEVIKGKLQVEKKKNQSARVEIRQLKESRMDADTNMEKHQMTSQNAVIEVAEAKARVDVAEDRAQRLANRVSELENQLAKRAEELARAVGSKGNREQLMADIEELASRESTLKAELEFSSEKSNRISQQLIDEERRLQVLMEQVNVTRERYARAQSELEVLEEKLQLGRSELQDAELEAKAIRRRSDEDRIRTVEAETRRSQIHAEIRELMDERRKTLRELGDLGAKRGHAEAELFVLVEKAQALSDAHEEALADIEEAALLRAKLSEEPLAQALLDDKQAFDALGPILERLEHARTIGYSVTLLDRAVERSLQVIQACVDHVAATPRHLLSKEVMNMLERQVPETAGAVRGLARWSVQQRLEHQLGETVGHLVVDLEQILEDHDKSITMLRRLRNVLEQLARLNAPMDKVDALLSNCNRPEALPTIAKETRKLIRVALDDIYMEADQREVGEAVALENTAKVLEELITQLDASGLSEGIPQGALWDFQRDGLLPFERQNQSTSVRAKVDDEMLAHIRPTLTTSEIEPADESISEEEEDGWERLESPNEEKEETFSTIQSTTGIIDYESSYSDERAALEAELAKLDAKTEVRQESNTEDDAMSALEARLDNLDL